MTRWPPIHYTLLSTALIIKIQSSSWCKMIIVESKICCDLLPYEWSQSHESDFRLNFCILLPVISKCAMKIYIVSRATFLAKAWDKSAKIRYATNFLLLLKRYTLLKCTQGKIRCSGPKKFGDFLLFRKIWRTKPRPIDLILYTNDICSSDQTLEVRGAH